MTYNLQPIELPEMGYLFIDGGCFRQMLNDISERYFDGKTIDLDYGKFAQYFSKVFYYDAIPAQKHDEHNDIYEKRIQNEKEFFDTLGSMDKFHVYLGSIHRRKRRIEQKQVDIMIAIDMLTHAFRKNMAQATLFTTDSDFIPLIDAMVQNGMSINLWYADTKNCRANKELIASADRKWRIGLNEIYANCSTSFIDKFKLPQAIPVNEGICKNEIHTWQDPNRGEMKLCKNDRDYVLIFRSENHHAQVSHPNVKMLRAYVDDRFKITIPVLNNE